MAFKIKRSIPLLFEGTIDPGKKLETPKNTKIAGSTGRGNGKRTGNVDSFLNDANNDGNMITRAVSKLQQKRAENIKAYQDKKNPKVSVSETKKSIEGSGKVSSSTTGAYGAGGTAESLLKGGSGKKVTKDKTPPPPPPPPKETKASGRQSKLSQTSLGKKGKQKKFGDEVSMKSDKFVPASRKTTVKAAPKDNSRKAIKARKTADKKAGVSKSQMRANKAKSKSEAASAKAKKSKNPSYRAQLTAKSERLAKRAKRKGGSPAKQVDPKPRTHAEILKAYPGAKKVEGKINTYKYKGATLNPALFPVEKKAKTVKQAIDIKEKK